MCGWHCILALAAMSCAGASLSGCQSSPQKTQPSLTANPSASAPPPSLSVAPSTSADAPRSTASKPKLSCSDLNPLREPAKPLRPPWQAQGRILGADASSLAPLKSLKEANVRFMLFQAAYGGRKNDSFRQNWEMAKACDLPRGAYHFVTPKRDATLQAKRFLEQLAGDPGDLPPIVDAERPVECKEHECCNLPCGTWRRLLETWISLVEKELGVTPMIYTVEPFWNQCLCGTKGFARHRLWLAGWPKFNFPQRLLTGGWPTWTYYQYKGNVRFAGGVIDLNLFQGDAAAFDEYLGKPSAVRQTP